MLGKRTIGLGVSPTGAVGAVAETGDGANKAGRVLDRYLRTSKYTRAVYALSLKFLVDEVVNGE